MKKQQFAHLQSLDIDNNTQHKETYLSLLLNKYISESKEFDIDLEYFSAIRIDGVSIDKND